MLFAAYDYFSNLTKDTNQNLIYFHNFRTIDFYITFSFLNHNEFLRLM